MAHQAECARHAEEMVSRPKLEQELMDKVNSYLHRHPQLHSEKGKQHLRLQARRYADLTFRHEIPRTLSRIEAEKEKAKKKQEDHDNCQAKYDAMDIKSLLALAVTEVNSQRQKGSQRNKKDGVVDYLLSQDPELKQELEKLKKIRQPKEQRRSSRARSTSKP
eukprot:832246-Alexandrium_andersonii.AAC.1